MPNVSINRKQLLIELEAATPLLKAEAEAIVRQQFFDPAVRKLQEEFEQHPVTQEIEGGVNASNVSRTLDAPFGEPPEAKDGRTIRDYSPPNLTSFIGFEAGSQPIAPIKKALDPTNTAGPKLKYVSRDRDALAFRYEISAPDWDAIEKATPLPWAEGISWARRIEQGIAGIGYFLNAKNRKGSRSGGGIQIDSQLRSGRFKPTKYLSDLFNRFLRRASSGREPLGE